MAVIAFFNIGMHGRVNPTLPVVAELVRRGHAVRYYTTPAFAKELSDVGADVVEYEDGGAIPDPPTPLALLEVLARSTLAVLPVVLPDLRSARPDLVVHDAACPWGAVAARQLAVPAAASYTTFAFNRAVPSPTAGSRHLLRAAVGRPGTGIGYLRARNQLRRRRFDTRALPVVDLGNIREPLNLVYTSRAFQPDPGSLDASYRFVGPSLGARPADPTFPLDRLAGPVIYASLGTVFEASPGLLRTFATALAPLGGTIVVATGRTDPGDLGPLPANVIARRRVPQLEVLRAASVFLTHGGMNSVNEALYEGVPMLVVPQGADQPLVADRVQELGAGLAIRTDDAGASQLRFLVRRLLHEPGFRAAAAALRESQRQAGGYRSAADELEHYLHVAPRLSTGSRE